MPIGMHAHSCLHDRSSCVCAHTLHACMHDTFGTVIYLSSSFDCLSFCKSQQPTNQPTNQQRKQHKQTSNRATTTSERVHSIIFNTNRRALVERYKRCPLSSKKGRHARATAKRANREEATVAVLILVLVPIATATGRALPICSRRITTTTARTRPAPKQKASEQQKLGATTTRQTPDD
mmetsp:Transcript_27074/g.76183  ORF Transcript_27074/g.76183 Transcript_27074/m.76183 type:complete len:179 (+) Transcript_27074:335-871(+)